MRIIVKAKPKSSKEYVKRTGETSFTVAVKEPPEKGKANQAIVKVLSKLLKIPLSSINLISGQSSRVKIFEIPLEPEDLEKIFSGSGQIKLL